jgi:diguanylate cyclase (GGDEF)-like protein
LDPRKELDLIRRILEKVNSPLTSEEIISIALQGIKDAFDCLTCAIIVIDPIRESFKIVNAKGWGHEFTKRFHGRAFTGFIQDASKLEGPLRVAEGSPYFHADTYSFEHPYQTLLLVPMGIRGKRVGVLLLSSGDAKAFPEDQHGVLQELANLCTIVLDHGSLGEQVIALSQFDPKTGMFGYQFWHEQLHREIVKTEKVDVNLSLMDIRINKFREFNSMNGHVRGDALLDDISRIIQDKLCELDVPCRVGPEWHVLLVGEDGEAARVIAEQILESVEKYAAKTKPRISMSIGLSTYIKNEKEKTLIQRVENALREARRQGGSSLQVQ